MALVKIYAQKATFSQTNGHWFMSIRLTFDNSQDLDFITKEYAKAKDIEADMRAMFERVRAAHPTQSFRVGTIIRRGDRKPNGYNNLPDLTHNAEREVQAVDNAVAELVAAGKIDPERAKIAA